MNKYIINRQVIYSQSLEVEAESEEQAIEIAETTSILVADMDFLCTDFYNIEDEDDDKESDDAE